MIRAALAGAVAGLVASWAMESFQAAWTTTTKQVSKGGPDDPARVDLPWDDGGHEPSTAKVASAVAEPLLDRELTEEEKGLAGETVHYAFGAMNGAIYGMLADALPPVRAANGMLFGAALWLGADELMLWGLGISEKPTEHPASTHLYALASHLVYGLTLESVRRAIRRLA